MDDVKQKIPREREEVVRTFVLWRKMVKEKTVRSALRTAVSPIIYLPKACCRGTVNM